MSRALAAAALVVAVLTGIAVALSAPHPIDVAAVAHRTAAAYSKGGVEAAAKEVPDKGRVLLVPSGTSVPPVGSPDPRLEVAAAASPEVLADLSRTGPLAVAQSDSAVVYVAAPVGGWGRLLPGILATLGALFTAALLGAALSAWKRETSAGTAPRGQLSGGTASADTAQGWGASSSWDSHAAPAQTWPPPTQTPTQAPAYQGVPSFDAPGERERRERADLVAGFAALTPRLPAGLASEAEAVLHRAGVERHQPAPGELFDPDRHASVGTEPAQYPEQEQTIARTERVGFLDHGAVVTRPMVVVHTSAEGN